ncbi:MAG: hypothetical protein A2Z14_02865 [Chloroflexi bacterium RBG_16_48_8]|nr:MAG: hypothetical protein A2Z14_02865 [Chloroflexi bacterium RBG_16_48_8]
MFDLNFLLGYMAEAIYSLVGAVEMWARMNCGLRAALLFGNLSMILESMQDMDERHVLWIIRIINVHL